MNLALASHCTAACLHGDACRMRAARLVMACVKGSPPEAKEYPQWLTACVAQTKHLAELCTLVIDDILGELPSVGFPRRPIYSFCFPFLPTDSPSAFLLRF